MPLLRSFRNLDTIGYKDLAPTEPAFSFLRTSNSGDRKIASTQGVADTGRAGAYPCRPSARVRTLNKWRDARLDNRCES